MSDVIILGIHDGHNSGAALSVNGEIVAAVSEERISRKKNDAGYPRRSIDEVLKLSGKTATELTEVCYSSLYMHTADHLNNHERWYEKGLEDQRIDFAAQTDSDQGAFDRQKTRRVAAVVDHLNVSEQSVKFLEHHTCHLAAAYFTHPAPQKGKKYLGLTADGSGDGVSATVAICQDNKFERVAETDRHASLGKIYSRVTYLMGMRPWEHEYKLMGMAPYSDPERNAKAAEPLQKLLGLSDCGLKFALGTEYSTNYCYEYLKEAFHRIRFDTISGATQLHCEELLINWVKNAIKQTGLTDVVVGGGVFMNVKANMLVSQIPELTSLYVMPSGGDESLSIGAALLRHYDLTEQADRSKSSLTDLYLGGTSSRNEEQLAIDELRERLDLEVEEPEDLPARVAELLAQNEIVACCRGRMEWGARALGNRSILTSAHRYERVDEINSMIKMRDFWMPFAPSILEEAAKRYFDDPKALKPWFMTFAYETLHEGYPDLRAGAHPRDRTIRPQIVRQTANPDYHRIISEFEKRTGRGVVLNTSFNLHGEPIVATSSDALRVLRKSGLTNVALNHFIVRKKI